MFAPRFSVVRIVTAMSAVMLAAASALAHPGHAATPAHAHVKGAVVDVGALALIALVAGAIALRVLDLRANANANK